MRFTLSWCNAEGVAVNQSLGDFIPINDVNHDRMCLNKKQEIRKM